MQSDERFLLIGWFQYETTLCLGLSKGWQKLF
ncbi:hypothetical protein RB2150_04203 [Rhodobacterales bacterium HTCC2150]|nr:hypothetical protein RB2150_04203 [Rhodobacterales bacterium HTCC2150] [Rhodobacteraceae bacterium HTCC2150]